MTELIQQLLDALAELFARLGTSRGIWTELRDYALLFPAAMCILYIAFTLLYVLYRERRLPFDPGFQPRIAVVVPCHNEEEVLEPTLRALLASEYPALEIHVVSDGSTDRTVEIARRYALRGVVVHDLRPNMGKSRALQHALLSIDAPLFMIVDADTVLAPNAIRLMVQQFADPAVAGVTGNPRVANVTNLLTAMQAMEYMSIIGMIKRADSFWGGLFSVSGAAACFRSEVLRKAGGWSDRTATEDIEMSWRLQKMGYALAFEPRALFQVQAPVRYLPLLRQRRRWAQGMAEVQRLHGNLLWTGNTGLIPVSFQVIATVAWFVLLFATIIAVAIRSWISMEHSLALSTLLTVFLLTMGLFSAQALTAALIDQRQWHGSIRLVPLAILYPLYYWLVIIPSFALGFSRGLFTHHSGQWNRTARTAVIEATAPLPGGNR